MLVPDRQPGSLRPRDAGPGGRPVPDRGRGPERRPRHDSGLEAGADRLRRHLPADPRGECRSRLHRRDRLDAHVLAGQDVDPRSGRPADPVAPPAHAGERRAPLGVDRHGLHEPQPGRPRRPGVRLHPDPARGGPQDRGGARVRSGGHRPGGRLAARRPGLVGDPQPQARPLRRQHAQRRGHRGGQGRGRAEVRGVGEHVRRERPGGGRRPGRRRRGRPADHRVRRSLRPRPRARPGRRPARVAPLRRPDRGGDARVPDRGRVRRLHHQLRGPGWSAGSCRDSRCSG